MGQANKYSYYLDYIHMWLSGYSAGSVSSRLGGGVVSKPTGISNYMHCKVWDEITYPFINFNGCTVEV